MCVIYHQFATASGKTIIRTIVYNVFDCDTYALRLSTQDMDAVGPLLGQIIEVIEYSTIKYVLRFVK